MEGCMRTFVGACVIAGVLGGAAVGAATTVAPVAVKEVKPEYPKDVLKSKVQGSVWLAIRVNTDGTVNAVRVTQPLHSRLDAEAVKAARQWRFKPGTKDGKPVSVDTQLEMTFTTR
jgi:TonB family protein